MSNVKKPMAGEWWECTDGFRLFVVGRKLSGSLLSQTERGNIETYTIGGDEWKHLPDCNGWNWKPEVFPQYWTTLDRESKRTDSVAFLIRKNKFDWNLVQKDGVHGINLGETSKWDSYLREQLTKEQAEALLLPKESPDDWVVQDRVPARAEIDRGHFGSKGRSPEDMWGFVSDSIGVGEMHGHQGMVVYCRRKDLPEISPKAETRTVVIVRWLCWNEVGKSRLIHAEKPPNGYKHCENRGEEKFEVSL